jgi:hypothetical protein
MSSNNDIITFTSDNGDKWVGEIVYDPGYEFSCDHCGTEMEDRVGGYWKDDVRYCAHCAWDLFDQPEPISAYKIWRQQKDEQERQEAERIRLFEEREEQERQYWRDQEEEHEYYLEWREKHNAECEAERKNLNNILAKQESARLQKKEQECMNKENDDLYFTRLYTGPEDHDPRYDYDSLQKEEANAEENFYYGGGRYGGYGGNDGGYRGNDDDDDDFQDEPSRSYDWDPKPSRCYDWDEQMPTDIENCDLLQSDHSRCYDWDQKPSRCYDWDEQMPTDIENCDLLQSEPSRSYDWDEQMPLEHDDYIDAHEKSLAAFQESNQGGGPIVSAIRVFEELSISNILFDSLVDLCEFY